MQNVSQALMTLAFLRLAGAVVIGVAVAAYVLAPRLRRLEQRLEALYQTDVPLPLRTALAEFWAISKPVVMAQLPSLGPVLMHSALVGKIATTLAARGISVTPGQMVALANEWVQEAGQAQQDTTAASAAKAAAAKATDAAAAAREAANQAQHAQVVAEEHKSTALSAAGLAVEAQQSAGKYAKTAVQAATSIGAQTAPGDGGGIATPAVPEAGRPGELASAPTPAQEAQASSASRA